MTTHQLPANQDTVFLGLIDRARPPVLTIDDGDEVQFETWGLWNSGITPDSTLADAVALRNAHPDRGPHSLTGPVAVRGARAGTLLQVDILDLQLGPHGFNMLVSGAHSNGLLGDRFEKNELRHFVFDFDRMEAIQTPTPASPGEVVPVDARLSTMRLPLRPFLGIMGVAPAQPGPHSSTFPENFGGNIDCADLVAGTTLFLPVWADGGLFYTGDAHAMQGHGEVDQSALETSMRCAHLRFRVHARQRLQRPHAVTAEHLITMGFHVDLREAAKQALADMVTWLSLEHGFTRSEAYVLCSLQADLIVTQAVNGNNGVHVRMARALLDRQPA